MTSQRHPPSVEERYRSLAADQRLGVVGALITMGSMALPWYGLQLGGGFGKTGFGAFGWVEAALLLTLGAALLLIYEIAKGRKLPVPLHEGTLVAACGLWAGALIVFRAFDRPNFEVGPIHESYDLRYGFFIALAGATLVAVAGFRRRHAALAREHRAEHPPTGS